MCRCVRRVRPNRQTTSLRVQKGHSITFWRSVSDSHEPASGCL
jgi:hypothetical protein